MDMWISSIVEGYIYEKVNKPDIIGHIHEYVERYGKKEGYWKIWHPNGQLWIQCYYKDWRFVGEFKRWYDNGQLEEKYYWKEGKREGEYKKWDIDGSLIEYKMYENGKIIQDLLFLE